MGGHGSLGDARLNAMTTYLPGFTYSTLHLTNSKRHACGHAMKRHLGQQAAVSQAGPNECKT